MSQQEDFSILQSTVQDYEVHAIFPIGVYTKENILDPDDYPELEDTKNIPVAKGAKIESYGDKSENTYVLDQPALIRVKKLLEANLNEYANNVLGLAGPYAITQSWVSVKHPGQQHVMHSHANSIISGVFYFGNDKSVSGLTFSKNAYVASTWQLDPLLNPNIATQFSFTEITLQVENTMVCLFPSFLAHKVDTNTTDKPRYSIAFNAVPRYALGLEGDLTELEFRRVARDH